MLVKQKIKKIKLILSILYLSYWQRATGNGQRATGNGQRATGNGQRATGRSKLESLTLRLYTAQDFLLCVVCSASVLYSVVQNGL
jgi:hypothetical protein